MFLNLRFEMKPGLTGYAQVKGRNNIIWEERIQYDIEYVKTFTFWLDIVILFKTVLLVFKKQGTEVKAEYRGVSRFSKHYVPEENQPGVAKAMDNLMRVPFEFENGGTRVIHYTPETYIPRGDQL